MIMDARTLIETMAVAERLKNAVRHSWTSQGRRESVAEHSWRLVLMACLVKDDFPEADWEKVLTMAALHDMGEAFTGDIPAFWKTDADCEVEANCQQSWCEQLPEPYRTEYAALFREMDALQTLESRIVKALDKMETLIQHNEADISTWLPLEYEKNLVYGIDEVAFSEKMMALREEIVRNSKEKILREGKREPK